MDITRPPLDRQVSPAPWLAYREKVDAPAAIRQVLSEKPEATADEIAETLAARGVQISRMIIAMWLNKLKAEGKDPGSSRSREAQS